MFRIAKHAADTQKTSPAPARIDRHVRGWDKPSDHVPVFVDLDIAGR